jgi:hypothetical protein
MAYNGSGAFSRLYNWVADRIAATPITASRFDAEMDGMATGLSTAICKDGQTTVTGKIPFAQGINVAAADPASPVNGDLWLTSSGLRYRVGSTTISPTSEVIETGSKSGAAIHDITLPQAFSFVELDLYNIVIGTDANINLKYNTGSILASGYSWALRGLKTDSTTAFNNVSSGAAVALMGNLAANKPASVKLGIENPAASRAHMIRTNVFWQTSSTIFAFANGVINNTNTSPLQGLRFTGGALESTNFSFDYQIRVYR